MSPKPKTNQPETPKELQQRDFFQTPQYAVDLLIPFIPKTVLHIWEPAAGNGKIVDAFIRKGFLVDGSDIQGRYISSNFLLEKPPFQVTSRWCIITNPPFSLKKKFYLKCKEYGIPFALLIPLDYSSWLIDAIRYDHAQKLIPTSRINYITPSGKSGKDSASQFHSGWLTWGFNLPSESECFVELTKEMKQNI